MITIVKSLFTHQAILKINACIIAYFLWAFLGECYMITQWVNVPICFYNIPANCTLTSTPATIQVCLQAKRTALRKCTDLAFHINADSLSGKATTILPQEEELFLPRTIKMVQYKPYTVKIDIKKETTA